MKWFATLVIALTVTLSPMRAAENKEQAEPDVRLLWANFVILVGGIGYLAAKKGGPYFAGRSAEIRKGISESEKLKAEAEARAGEVNAKLANLEAEIAAIRSTIREEQARENDRIQRETAAELARIQAHGEQEIEAAGKAARLELQRHAARLALELAERKLRVRMTPQMQNALARSFVEDLRR